LVYHFEIQVPNVLDNAWEEYFPSPFLCSPKEMGESPAVWDLAPSGIQGAEKGGPDRVGATHTPDDAGSCTSNFGSTDEPQEQRRNCKAELDVATAPSACDFASHRTMGTAFPN
jgi:hypothetical protein